MHPALAFTIGSFAFITGVGIVAAGLAVYYSQQENEPYRYRTSSKRTKGVLEIQRELRETQAKLKELQNRRHQEERAQLEKKKQGSINHHNVASEPVLSASASGTSHSEANLPVAHSTSSLAYLIIGRRSPWNWGLFCVSGTLTAGLTIIMAVYYFPYSALYRIPYWDWGLFCVSGILTARLDIIMATYYNLYSALTQLLEKKKERPRNNRNVASEPNVLSARNSHLKADILTGLDETLNFPRNIQAVENAKLRLEDLCLKHPNNVELLYRLGQAYHKLAEQSKDNNFIHTMLDKGIRACKSALKAAPEHGDVHKWYAALLGTKSQYSSSYKEQSSYGLSFKQHLDKALTIKPNDYQLHFMLGMFKFAIASLNWIQRSAAAAFFGNLPNTTYAEAESCFIKVQKMAPFAWKENYLMLGKCKIAMSQYKEGVNWLKMALHGRSTNLGQETDTELNALLQKHRSYY